MSIPQQSPNLMLNVNLGDLPDFLTVKEYEEILHKINEPTLTKGWRHKENSKLLLQVLMNFGMRVSDALILTPSHFKFKEKVVRYHIKKTKKDHQIALSDKMALILEMYILKNKLEAHERIFPFNRQRAHNKVVKMGMLIGKRIHQHTLRHSLVMAMLTKQVSLPIISKYVGHSSINTTINQYMKVSIDMQRDALEKLDI